MNVIEVKNLVKTFKVGKKIIPALRGINLVVKPGEFIVIQGPSGCGKTTLLNMLARLEDLDSGEILVRGKNIKNLTPNGIAKYRRMRLGMIFQTFNLIPSLTALENVALPLVFSGLSKKERTKRAEELLKTVGLLERKNHLPGELSGGEQQRVAIARALVFNPWILLCDEPTGNLDQASGKEIIRLLENLNRNWKRTIILATHDLIYSASAHRIYRMKDGKIIGVDEVPAEMIKKPTEKIAFPPSYFIPSKLKNFMKVSDVFRSAFGHLSFAKLRTFFTTAGVGIAAGAIILLVSLGFGLQKITTSQLASWDALHTISVNVPSDSQLKLDDKVVGQIKNLENVSLVSPILNYTASVTLEKTTTALLLTGILPEVASFEGVQIQKGNLFSGPEAGEAVISQNILKSYGLPEDYEILGKTLHLEIVGGLFEKEVDLSKLKTKSLDIKIVGITSEKVAPTVFAPLLALQKINSPYYHSLNVKVSDRKKLEQARDEIEKLGFETGSLSDLISQVDKTFLFIQLALAGLGGIALMVASFGIINTMIISLLERSREIGTMKALGITNKDIKRIFTCEAVLFGLFGGLLGAGGGFLLGKTINGLLGYLMKRAGEPAGLEVFVIPWKFAVLVILFTIFISYLAGLYPAKRAAKISPLDALRYE